MDTCRECGNYAEMYGYDVGACWCADNFVKACVYDIFGHRLPSSKERLVWAEQVACEHFSRRDTLELLASDMQEVLDSGEDVGYATANEWRERIVKISEDEEDE